MGIRFDYQFLKRMIDGGAIVGARQYFSRKDDRLSLKQKLGIFKKVCLDYDLDPVVRGFLDPDLKEVSRNKTDHGRLNVCIDVILVAADLRSHERSCYLQSE